MAYGECAMFGWKRLHDSHRWGVDSVWCPGWHGGAEIDQQIVAGEFPAGVSPEDCKNLKCDDSTIHDSHVWGSPANPLFCKGFALLDERPKVPGNEYGTIRDLGHGWPDEGDMPLRDWERAQLAGGPQKQVQDALDRAEKADFARREAEQKLDRIRQALVDYGMTVIANDAFGERVVNIVPMERIAEIVDDGEEING